MKDFSLIKKLSMVAMFSLAQSSFANNVVETNLTVDKIYVGKLGKKIPSSSDILLDPNKKYLVVEFNPDCESFTCQDDSNTCKAVDTVIMDNNPFISELYSMLLSSQLNGSKLNVEFVKAYKGTDLQWCLVESAQLLRN